MNETALFYNLSPDKTIAREQIEGSKKVLQINILKAKRRIKRDCHSDSPVMQMETIDINHYLLVTLLNLGVSIRNQEKISSSSTSIIKMHG